MYTNNDVERLKTKVREEMIKYADRSVVEAEVIAEAIKENNISSYIDVGCWAGTLAKDVLTRVKVKALLIDASQVLLSMCFDNLKDDLDLMDPFSQTHIKHAAIIPDESWIARGKQQLIIPYESSGSASIINPKKHKVEDCYIEKVDCVITSKSLPKVTDAYGINFSKSYLKLDIEGLDLMVVEKLLEANTLPEALHFEVHSLEEYGSLHDKHWYKLNEHYKFPKDVDVPLGHEFYSISMTRKGWTILGMNPDKIYKSKSLQSV